MKIFFYEPNTYACNFVWYVRFPEVFSAGLYPWNAPSPVVAFTGFGSLHGASYFKTPLWAHYIEANEMNYINEKSHLKKRWLFQE